MRLRFKKWEVGRIRQYHVTCALLSALPANNVSPSLLAMNDHRQETLFS